MYVAGPVYVCFEYRIGRTVVTHDLNNGRNTRRMPLALILFLIRTHGRYSYELPRGRRCAVLWAGGPFYFFLIR